MSVSVKHALWECSEYSSIHKEFINNFDGILQNDFHHLTRLITYLTKVFGNVMVILIIGFQILRLFCVVYETYAKTNVIL